MTIVGLMLVFAGVYALIVVGLCLFIRAATTLPTPNPGLPAVQED